MIRPVIILPAQAEKIAEVTAKTGVAVGVSQHGGSVLTLDLGEGVRFGINAKGEEIVPQEETLC